MRKIIFSVLLISTLCFGAYKTFAQCSCVPKLTLQEHFQNSDVVFIGKVVEAKKIDRKDTENYDTIVVKFEVKQTWKQDLEKFVVVEESYGSVEGFEPNAEWLIYARKDNDGRLQIHRGCCSRTKSLSTAKKQGDLKAFKQMGEKPKKVIEK